MRQEILLTLALTFSLSLTACGGSVNSPGAQSLDAASTLGGLDAGAGLAPLESFDEGGLESFDEGGLDTGFTDDFGAEPADGFVDEGLPAEEFVDELPPEEFVDELPAEEFVDEVPADEFADDTLLADDTLDELPDLGGDSLDEIPDLDVLPPYVPEGSSLGGGSDYMSSGSFLVDQDTFNQWQAVNLSTDGSSLYIAAVDVSTPKKGSVIKMDTAGGNWQDIGKSTVSTITFGAFGYSMSESLQSVAQDSNGNLVALDTNNMLYQLSLPDFDVEEKEVSLTGGMDIVSHNGSYYVTSAQGVQKFDSSLNVGTAFGSVSPTGGLGVDADGNLYVVSEGTIQKMDASGNATEVVTGLNQPLDVAVDSEGTLFVLENSGIRYFNASGEEQGQFAVSEFKNPRGIVVDSSGAVYVADAGTTYEDSAVIRFSKGGV